MSVVETPIICPHCGKPSGYTHEGIMFLVITAPLMCWQCGKAVIQYPQVVW